jgi:tetratricopeptide (TPR) repeat protein
MESLIVNNDTKKDFFISYNKADRLWAEWIAWHLEDEGYTTLIQAWDFRPGSNFILEMNKAVIEADRTIAIISPDYLTSQYTQTEWTAVLARDPSGEHGTLLPIRVRECDLKGILPQIIYIDLVELEESDAQKVLLSEIRQERVKPTVRPIFPDNRPRSLFERPRFPTSLPLIWNLPNRNLNFTGRDEILLNLNNHLKINSYTVVTQAISGLGGIGKTQVAIEYAYRFSNNYDLVWWMRSEEPTTLAADYARLAWKIGIPEKDAAEQAVTVEAVRNWLGQNEKWLLIFDNANDQSEIINYLPQGGGGHVLITSRNQNWRGVAQPLSVTVLTQEESVSFILKRTGQADRDIATLIAEELGNLPLALEQASAFIEATGRSLSDYLKLFLKFKSDLLRRGNPSTDYPYTVATTWEISFQQVQESSHAGGDLMNLCAFLAPDEIPRKLLSEGSKYLPGNLAAAESDTLILEDAVVALRCYSLIDANIDSLSIHRLVQAVVQDRLPVNIKKATAESALNLVNEAFPSESDDVRTWPICKPLLSHALAVTRYAEDLKLHSVVAGRLLNQVGLYLRGRAEFVEAKEVLNRALTFDVANYGWNHPTVAIRINNLGELLETLGELSTAKKYYERALAINEKAYGPNHPTVASNINNLGNVLKKLSDLKNPVSHYDQVSIERLSRMIEDNINKDIFGSLAPTVVFDNLIDSSLFDSEPYQAVKDLVIAKTHYERALAINERAYGPNHPTVANNLNNLGNVLVALSDSTGAKVHFERALAINEMFYGADHPTVASIINSLGSVLKRLGDLEGARKYFERALTIDEKFYGPKHPIVALRINNIGRVLQELGNNGEARTLYIKALSIFRDTLGENHSYTLIVQSNLDSVSLITIDGPDDIVKRLLEDVL